MRKILILHGNDAHKEAQQLTDFLAGKLFTVKTYSQVLSQKPVDMFAVELHHELLSDYDYAIGIASPRLFKNGFLINCSTLFVEEQKFIPVLIGHSGTKTYRWFEKGSPVDINQDFGLLLKRLT